MAELIQLHSRVGADGVLNLQVPLGIRRAQADVLVTIQELETPATGQTSGLTRDEIIVKTYGAWSHLDIEEPEELPFEEREAFE